ncbi:DUF2690 domain-containing protein [Kitasatospora sp. NBC_01560]|uniref:helix-turn-helix domain-containing protein n=1 Tax=Kitasatospora sp. NBC_01560 TaxID=2975965 RepID=UPI003868ECEF
MASAWKQLPDDLSAPAKRLTEELRAVKDTTGLSLSELATRTHYSRASWERWLNGKRIVTEQALEALIRAVECDGPALRRLWAETSAPEDEAAGGPEGAAQGLTTGVTEVEAVPETVVGAGTESGAGSGAGSTTESRAENGAENGAEDLVEADPADGPQGAPGTAGDAEPVLLPADDAEPVLVPAEPATAAPRRWRRPVALLTGALVVTLLLVLAGLRYTHRTGGDPATVAQPLASSGPASKPASPAPPGTCQAMGCSHKDPKTTGCGADARTLQTGNIGKVVIYLRYSQKCQAAWAAITEGEPDDFATITSSTGETEMALIHWGYDNYSAMVNAADPNATFRVCGHQPAGNDCTANVSGLAQMVASTPIPIGPASPPATSASPALPPETAASPAAPPAGAPSPSASS